jgi:hypothetical protein
VSEDVHSVRYVRGDIGHEQGDDEEKRECFHS